MNIYYVNRNSNLKGPFDIIDSNRQHIIKVGDICLRDTSDGIAFYVVYNSSNSWNSCKVVGFGDNDTLSDIGNTLLFSFDGLSRRKGNIALIKQVRMCFREKVIDDFFCNALDILEYKRDFWEGSLFPQFFASTQELVDRDEQKKPDLSNDTNHYPSIFAKYLSEELLELLINSLNDGNELKEAYQILRTKHPELFRKALMKFLTENPSGTIFDKPADAYVPTLTVTEVEVPKATIHNLRVLRSFGYIEDFPLRRSDRTERFIREIGYQPLLSIDEEVELAQKIRKGECGALNKLVSANMRIVVGIAKEFLHNGLEFDELIQEGFFGLIKAAKRFDETRGFAFGNYAPWWIRRSISDAIVRNSSLIQFPMSVRILHRKIWDFKVIYEHQNGFFPPVTEIEIAGEDDFDRISFLNSLPNNLSNTCIPCEDYDVYEDVHNDIWEYENNDYNKYYVSSLLARLSKRERNVLLRAFGIGVRAETLEMIGDSMGLTRERVRQIKEKAIKKIRDIASVISVEEKLSDDQSTRKLDRTVNTTTIKNIKETQTLKDVRMVFLQNSSNIVQFKSAKKIEPTQKDAEILPSEETHGHTSQKIRSEIDEFGIEHVFVDTTYALPFIDVEVENEHFCKDKIAEEGETLPIWAFAENLRFAKRSKNFLECMCSVGLSKTGYFLILGNRNIKLGNYPEGYQYNDGNIWIKRPIDDKGYRMMHENEKGIHLIGYAKEINENVVFTNPDNDVYSVSFDGKITSVIRSEEVISLKDIDIDKLRHAFDKKATSYKYFWFLAILKIYHETRMDTISYKDILIGMVSLAWRYVFIYKSQFPSQDQLPVYLKAIQAKSYLGKTEMEKIVEDTVHHYFYEWKCNTLLAPLLNNVPYRFLSPWIPFTNNEEVISKSTKTVSRCPYSITNDHIQINPLWSSYLLENYDKISLNVEKKLMSYLKCK